MAKLRNLAIGAMAAAAIAGSVACSSGSSKPSATAADTAIAATSTPASQEVQDPLGYEIHSNTAKGIDFYGISGLLDSLNLNPVTIDGNSTSLSDIIRSGEFSYLIIDSLPPESSGQYRGVIRLGTNGNNVGMSLNGEQARSLLDFLKGSPENAYVYRTLNEGWEKWAKGRDKRFGSKAQKILCEGQDPSALCSTGGIESILGGLYAKLIFIGDYLNIENRNKPGITLAQGARDNFVEGLRSLASQYAPVPVATANTST